ncbi:restriction endonuclease subunit S, partial [Blautia hydrogenotrophica]|uniref:restriction endonuclease subunit S n=1 Tax=Blautia hydrogenotrophica TaxID=53443 RepID=UPI0006DD0C47
MSKLEELIQKLCPDGVEYKRVSDLCNVSRGIVISKQFIEGNKGDYPVYSSQTENNGELGRINAYRYDGEYLTWTTDGANAGSVFYRNGKFSVTNVCGLLEKKISIFNLKFLYYVLTIEAPKHVNRGMGNPKLMSNIMSNIAVPVPPRPIQDEIVRILDNFTELTEELTKELTEELTEELTARKKQYEYYRDKLLTYDKKIPMVKLKKIATEIYRGAGIKRDQVTSDGIPCVRYGEIYTTYNTWFDKCVSHTQIEYISSPKYFEHGDILFAITGESVEDIAKSVVYVGNEKCLAGGDIVVMKHKQNPKYLAYVLSTYEARRQKTKGKIKSKVVHSNVPSIENIEIPLPSLEVQERFADVLDNF